MADNDVKRWLDKRSGMWYPERAQALSEGHGGLEGSFLPGGSGGEQSPEDLRALEVYEERMRGFETGLWLMGLRPHRRNDFRDYQRKNCEEAWGGR